MVNVIEDAKGTFSFFKRHRLRHLNELSKLFQLID